MILKLLGWLATTLLGWLWNRHEAQAPARAANDQAKAEAQAETTRDQADARVESAREASDASIRQAQHDVAAPDGVRRGAADVQRAIDQANRELR
jgi:hypothetical protein